MATVRGRHSLSASTVVVEYLNKSGQAMVVGDGSFEAYNYANIATYQQATSEKGSSAVYEATVPTSSVLPIVLEYQFRDTTLGVIFAGGELNLDANGDEVVLGEVDLSTVTDAIAAVQVDVTAMHKLERADLVSELNGSDEYEKVWLEENTSTELMRKAYNDTSGDPVDSLTDVVGSLIYVSP